MKQDQYQKYVIETVGEGEIYVDADLIYLTLGVMTENQNVETAISENAIQANNVLSSLYSLGVPQNHIETINFSIQPVYDYKDGTSELKGFKVENIFRVKLQDVEMAGKVYDTAIKNGASIARSLTFEVSNKDNHERAALQVAYQNAFYKAITLAQAMGVNLNLIPFRVQEAQMQNNNVPYKAEFLQTASTPIQPQKVSIRAGVNVWFCYYY